MATARITSTVAGVAATLVILAALGSANEAPVTAQPKEGEHERRTGEGFAAAKARQQERDAIEAAFPRESYRPGDLATLNIWTKAPGTTVLVCRVGPERKPTRGNKTMEGVPVTAARPVVGSPATIEVGDWPSGLYFAKLAAPGRVGYAPFVVGPKRLGVSRVAVVLPTRTWQAYNFRDDDRDGDGDTWYAAPGHPTARLGRPFLNRGVPPHYRHYDSRFLRWLYRSGKSVDILAQADVEEASPATLRRAYDLLVFPGHHEYVTEREYDAVEGFRNLGGSLMFLSANNFFWRIDVRNGVMTRIAKWRDLGRPEAGLVGVQYIGNDRGERQAPWRVSRASANRWLFNGVTLGEGGTFAKGGIEIDAVARSSPRPTQVVARIPNLLGPGKTANMSYYELPNGAKVFAAGAFTLAGLIYQRPVQRLVENVWVRLTPRTATTAPVRALANRSREGKLPPEALRGVAHELDQYPTLAVATPAQQAIAARLLRQMRSAARRWRNPRLAARDGYNVRRPRRKTGETRVMWFHAEYLPPSERAGFDPARPGTLIYADLPGRPLALVGVMFSMPRGLRGPSPAGPITRWHWHRVCVRGTKRGLTPRSDGTCPPGSKLRDGSEMMHVWLTGDLRSAYAIHAPVPELCTTRLLPARTCVHDGHVHG